MTLIYRAIWTDDLDRLTEFANDNFRSWAQAKVAGHLEIPDVGASAAGPFEVSIEREHSSDVAAVRCTLHEEVNGERWTTRLRAYEAEGDQWLWVDVECVAADSYKRRLFAAPRLVRTLLELGSNPRTNGARLFTSTTAITGTEVDDFIDELVDPDRDIPYVVFTPPSGAVNDLWLQRAAKAARTLAGVANVYTLSEESVREFCRIMSRELGVWGGAVRTYIPGVDLENMTPWRHRYIPFLRLRETPLNQAATSISNTLSGSTTARRAPKSYSVFKHLLEHEAYRAGEEWEELITGVDEEIADLRQQKAELEDQLLASAADLDEAVREQARLRAQLSSLHTALARTGSDELWAAVAELESASSDSSVSTPSEAAQRCRDSLSEWVSLPEAACVQLDALDDCVEASAWAETAWQGFQALAAYAQAENFSGGFWEWCQHSGNPLAWRATPKKLAMSESESVKNNEKLRRTRILPVTTDLEPSGKLYMEAHLKVAEGGGARAPRIYFHDDTKGKSGRIHVGYFGPHSGVPNKGA